MNTHERLVKMGRVAIQAGKIALRHFNHLHGNEIFHKGTDTDMVTVVDREVETFVRGQLETLFPDIDFYGEEGDYGSLARYDRVFIVDPIDGTTCFIHGHPFFSVSIGLREGGETTAGVVYMPVFDTLYWAARGEGAWRDRRRIHVTANNDLLKALGGTGFGCVRGHVKPDNVPMYSEMIYRLRGIRTCGSAAIDLCFVAEGHYDVYWEFKLCPYDWEAGSLIIREAGGKVSGFDGKPVEDTVGHVLATNGILHDTMLEALSRHC